MRELAVGLKQLRMRGMAGALSHLVEQGGGGGAALESLVLVAREPTALGFTDAANDVVLVGGPNPAT